jgi:hypothetical protein
VNIEGNKQVTPRYQKAAGSPSTDQLKVINLFALAELNADSVYVRTAYLAHNAIDRDGEVFDDAVLADFARTLPGKGLFRKHPAGWDGDSGPGVGRWHYAKVRDMSLDEAREALGEPNLKFPASTQRAKLLEASFYIPRSGKNTDLIADIDAGVAGDVSIGFRAADRSTIDDGNGNRIALRILGPAEAMEGSLVWLGAQPGARVHKNAQRSQETDMDLKQENETLKTENATLKAIKDKFEAIAKAVGELFANDPKALLVAVNDGKAFRTDLLDRIIKAERLAGLIKADDETAVKAAKAVHEDSPLDRLKAYLDRVEKLIPKGAQIPGGDPNARGGDKDPPAAKDAGGIPSPLDNPLITGKAA